MPVYRLIGTDWTPAQKLVTTADPNGALEKVLFMMSKKLGIGSMKHFSVYTTNKDKKPDGPIDVALPLDKQGVKQGDYIFVAPSDMDVYAKYGTKNKKAADASVAEAQAEETSPAVEAPAPPAPSAADEAPKSAPPPPPGLKKMPLAPPPVKAAPPPPAVEAPAPPAADEAPKSAPPPPPGLKKMPLAPPPVKAAPPPPAVEMQPEASIVGVRPAARPRFSDPLASVLSASQVVPPAPCPVASAATCASDLVVTGSNHSRAGAELLALAELVLADRPADALLTLAGRATTAASPSRAASMRNPARSCAPPVPRRAESVAHVQPSAVPVAVSACTTSDDLVTPHLGRARATESAAAVRQAAQRVMAERPSDALRFMTAAGSRGASQPTPRSSSPRRVQSVAVPPVPTQAGRAQAAPVFGGAQRPTTTFSAVPVFESREGTPTRGASENRVAALAAKGDRLDQQRAPPPPAVPNSARTNESASPPRREDAVPTAGSASPSPSLREVTMPQHDQSPRQLSRHPATGPRRRVVAPSREALQRYENAADPLRLENTFVATSPRAGGDFSAGSRSPRRDTSKGNAAATPSPEMVDALHTLVQREVRDSMLSASSPVPNQPGSPSPTKEAAEAARADAASRLAAAQQRRDEVRRERERLEAEIAEWSHVAERRAQVEAAAASEAADRDTMLRELHILRHQQEAARAAAADERRRAVERVQHEAQSRVDEALAAVAARDAAYAARHEQLDVALAESRNRRSAAAAYDAQSAERQRSLDAARSQHLSIPLVGGASPAGAHHQEAIAPVGGDAELMRQRLAIADLRRQKELLRHEISREGREPGYIANVSPAPTHHAALHSSTPRRSDPSVMIPEHFTPVSSLQRSSRR